MEMDVVMLLSAFGMGFVARAVGLPPLIGYLLAGFGLSAAGFESSDALDAIADLGVLLLLFGIGLQLRLRTLARTEVWATASVFAVATTVGSAALLLAVGAVGIPVAADLDIGSALIVGFAFSFCSTVFTVKALERTNEAGSLAGRVAIGVLILQDIFAVAFLVAMGDGLPSAWALVAVPALIALRPVFFWLLDRAGHGETLILLGFAMTVGVGAQLFSVVGLKPDLGALIAGLLLSTHPRAKELAKRLLDFKDIFLVGFFLTIGLAGIPSGAATGIGVLFVLMVPLRSGLLLMLLTRFRLRPRTALNASLSLSTYSEFGLIVAAAALSKGLIGDGWLGVVAVAAGLSFLVASIGTRSRYALYTRYGNQLKALERHPPLDDDAIIDIPQARILVFGMGWVGMGAYDEFVLRRGPVVLGVEQSDELVTEHVAEGRNVIRGNALDRDFWERVQLHDVIELVVATMGNHEANMECVRRIREFLPDVPIAAIATFADEIQELRKAGVDVARNLYQEAGQALADDTVATIYDDGDQAQEY